MPQSLARVYLHSVWSTKNRHPFIHPQIEEALYPYIGGIIKGLGGDPILMNGMPDHIHVLSTLPRTISISAFMEEIKRSSSKWVKYQDQSLKDFAWQRGYGVFSVSKSSVPAVFDYIQNQKKHHVHRAFKEELIALLKEYEIEYDERYLWD